MWNLLNKIETQITDFLDINLDDYLDKVSTYIYKFKNQNGQYVFKEISLPI